MKFRKSLVLSLVLYEFGILVLFTVFSIFSIYLDKKSALLIIIISAISFILISVIMIYHIIKHFSEPLIKLRNDIDNKISTYLDIENSYLEVPDFKDEFEEISFKLNTFYNVYEENFKHLEAKQVDLENQSKDLKTEYDKLYNLVYSDSVTGLMNRAAFIKKANDILHSYETSFDKFIVIHIDLDNFKNTNDCLGHEAGDTLLKKVAEWLSHCISKDDIIGRTGGDEFTILSQNINSIFDIHTMCSKLLDIRYTDFLLGNDTVSTSISIGVSVFPHNGLSLYELMKNADIAMYTVKSSTKNNYALYDSKMDDDLLKKTNIEEILNTVIAKDQLFAKYQPQADAHTGEIIGLEALMRIKLDDGIELSPYDFISIAEKSGHILSLGKWILYKACSFNQSLAERGIGDYRISVNVSSEQLKDPEFIEIVKAVPAKTGMPLSRLELEITESILMESIDTNIELIREIKNLGVRIALDDFGTCYSSFNYLAQLPIDTLKIDKTFIDNIEHNDKDSYITNTIINMAHAMNLSVVAEGVEDIKQLSILQKQSCDIIQGYLFSKPLSDEQLVKFINKNH